MMRRFAVAAARRCHAGRLPQWHADRAQHRTVAIVSIATATTTTARQSRVLRGRFAALSFLLTLTSFSVDSSANVRDRGGFAWSERLRQWMVGGR